MTHIQFLSSPICVRGNQVKNRIVVPPMADFGATNADELVNARHLKHYVAIRCQKAGFDGIELHAAHGFYLDQVIETSNRMDEYGGTFIDSGIVAESILQKGYADFVAVGRGHLCDPTWGNKILHGKEPFYCVRCRKCMWYIDGEKCPVVKKRRKVEEI